VPAILVPGRTPLTFASLSAHVEALAGSLAGSGLEQDRPIAAVLPDDAQTLVAFLAASPVTGFAPMNPDLRQAEFEACLRDLGPSALLVPAGARSSAAQAAKALEIPILEARATPERGAGLFTVSGLKPVSAAPSVPDPSALGLALQTSATTGRAKCVFLTHANLDAMIRASLEAMLLSPTDRFLSMMPLFHLQGLLSACAQLAAGGSVICAAPFDAGRFPGWIDELQPTWYTAGPALHRTILALWRERPELAGRSRLRFVRSIGAALAPELLRELEQTLRVPVLEGYGLTEAGAVTSTPLSPYTRRAGSAGVRIAPGVEIMDAAGNLLPPGQTGEIVVRGPSVMKEYRNSPQATRDAFRSGWFRTGDLGRFDDDGFLYVTGRLKEIVNRGGEKILPGEIDTALLEHPAVADAAAFGIPHPQLGEDVAAAVVLRAGKSVQQNELREFLAARLAAFKVPRVYRFLDHLPRGASGKVQRMRLAEEFAELQRARQAAAVGPGTDDERKLAGIWAAVLGIPAPGIDEDFFELGGHSLASARILSRIEEVFGLTLRHDAILAAPTVRRLAVLLHDSRARREQVVAIQPQGSKPAFFMVRPLPLFRSLAMRLGKERPFLGLVMPRREQLAGGCDLPGVARQLVSAVRQEQPSGPYHLGGWCADGVLAFEMAQQLTAEGEEVALLALFDSPNPALLKVRSARITVGGMLRALRWRLRFQVSSLRQLPVREALAHIAERIAALAPYVADELRGLVKPEAQAGGPLAGTRHPSGIRVRISGYEPRPYFGRLALFPTAGPRPGPPEDTGCGWAGVARNGLAVHAVPGDHISMFLEPNVEVLSRRLAAELERADSAAGTGYTLSQGEDQH
jgi:acyl-CoA synthetase (AMP-forming)/AMP-acid ligase II/thioesterase domain-containing protein/acyl carrier protein